MTFSIPKDCPICNKKLSIENISIYTDQYKCNTDWKNLPYHYMYVFHHGMNSAVFKGGGIKIIEKVHVGDYIFQKFTSSASTDIDIIYIKGAFTKSKSKFIFSETYLNDNVPNFYNEIDIKNFLILT